MSRVEVMREYPVTVCGDYEVLVDVYFYYYPPYPGVMNPPDKAQPPEDEEVEIVKLLYDSGARTEVEESIFMATVQYKFENDEEFLAELEQAVLDYVHELEERATDAHIESLIERRLDDGDF